jgi:hypothetical protein
MTLATSTHGLRTALEHGKARTSSRTAAESLLPKMLKEVSLASGEELSAGGVIEVVAVVEAVVAGVVAGTGRSDPSRCQVPVQPADTSRTIAISRTVRVIVPPIRQTMSPVTRRL